MKSKINSNESARTMRANVGAVRVDVVGGAAGCTLNGTHYQIVVIYQTLCVLAGSPFRQLCVATVLFFLLLRLNDHV